MSAIDPENHPKADALALDHPFIRRGAKTGLAPEARGGKRPMHATRSAQAHLQCDEARAGFILNEILCEPACDSKPEWLIPDSFPVGPDTFNLRLRARVF